MTSYPVNFSYSRDDGVSHSGFAASAAEAIAAAQDFEGPDWRVTGVELVVSEEFAVAYDPSAAERDWSAEIAAGWVQVARSGSGPAPLTATYWRATVEPAE